MATTEGKAPEVLAVAIVFFVLTWITVGLRVWVRTGMLRAFGWDDWTMLATQILFTAYLACQLGGVVYGTGRHLHDLEFDRAEKALQVRLLLSDMSLSTISKLKLFSSGSSANSYTFGRPAFSKSA